MAIIEKAANGKLFVESKPDAYKIGDVIESGKRTLRAKLADDQLVGMSKRERNSARQNAPVIGYTADRLTVSGAGQVFVLESGEERQRFYGEAVQVEVRS